VSRYTLSQLSRQYGKTTFLMKKVFNHIQHANTLQTILKQMGKEQKDTIDIRLSISRAIKANKACMKSIRNNYLCNQRKRRQVNNV